MEVINTLIPDIKIISPRCFEDKRGLFFESYNKKVFDEKINQDIRFVQDNSAISKLNPIQSTKDNNASLLIDADIFE